jgi:hypothetical protein
VRAPTEWSHDTVAQLPADVRAMGEALALSAAEVHQGDTVAALRWLWLRWRPNPSESEQAVQRVATRVLLDVADDDEVATWRTWWSAVGWVLVVTTQLARRRLARPGPGASSSPHYWN